MTARKTALMLILAAAVAALAVVAFGLAIAAGAAEAKKKRLLPPGCEYADQVMLDYATRFGADGVRWLDREQTRRYWGVFNASPPPTAYGSDNLIVAGGRFIVPVLAGVACRAIAVRVPELHRRALDRAIDGEPSL